MTKDRSFIGAGGWSFSRGDDDDKVAVCFWNPPRGKTDLHSNYFVKKHHGRRRRTKEGMYGRRSEARPEMEPARRPTDRPSFFWEGSEEESIDCPQQIPKRLVAATAASSLCTLLTINRVLLLIHFFGVVIIMHDD
jgi:hypothetical protein